MSELDLNPFFDSRKNAKTMQVQEADMKNLNAANVDKNGKVTLNLKSKFVQDRILKNLKLLKRIGDDNNRL